MTNKYGIYQESKTSCIFYKEDMDGRQSTFNLFVAPEESENKMKFQAFIDNEQMDEKNWYANKNITIKDVVDTFGGWASDAPLLFELNAHKSIEKCLKSVMEKEE